MPELHESVLKDEILEFLALKTGQIVLDATIGSGGHSEAILPKILPGGKIIGLDQDAQAIERTRERLAAFKDNISLHEANFRYLDLVLSSLSIRQCDAILFDLGFSLNQVRDPQGGFSFMIDAPLDMRMSLKSPLKAADLISTLSESELADIFWGYGGEPRSRKIASYIVQARRKRPIERTLELAQIAEKCVGRKRGRIHPATRIFQALRIVVNDELGAIREAIPKAVNVLRTGGRIAVIAFHSLEDRIVKSLFWENELAGVMKPITRKPMIPSQEEQKRNPRSRSAKLRVAEKL